MRDFGACPSSTQLAPDDVSNFLFIALMSEFKSKVIEALNLIINAELVEGHNGIYEII